MTLWGGRFDGSMSEVTRRYTGDHSDRRLLQVDVEGSIAHVTMLGETGIITSGEADDLLTGLETILGGVDEFEFQRSDEDVHTAVERRLGELVGEVAGKLHTGRSRNDQVALDLRLYLRSAADERIDQVEHLVELLASLAHQHAETPVASYTHLQQAQVTTLGHHLLAHAWMLTRDANRFATVRSGSLDSSPLGAGASAGSMLPLDRQSTAHALGFREIVANSLDAVGSRDFVSDYVYSCAQTMVDLSRLAEEIVLWSTKEFKWLRLDDSVSTGSSALPQKRNPDIAELVRGRAAGVVGDMTTILTLQKGVPLTYNRDFQEDKRVVFHADDTTGASLEAMAALIEGVEFHPPVPEAETTAIDLAESLVSRGVPFREAHTVVGRLVKHLEEQGRTLDQAVPEDLAMVDARFKKTDLALLDPLSSVRHRVTEGSGSPESVTDQISQLNVSWRDIRS